jgi:AcrR family transcriptional regulator
MIKIIMEHDERMNDIIDKAENLFAEKGYDKTSIADIIDKVGIAKGTFYHYFSSKDELLDKIVERMLNEIWDKADIVVAKKDQDAIEKFIEFFNIFRTIAEGREKLIEDLHNEDNAHIHLKLEKKMYPEMAPKFAIIIRQGINEGVFDTKYPDEAAMVIMVSISALTEISEHVHGLRNYEVDLERLKMFLDLIERILGTTPGIFMKYINEHMEVGLDEKK